MQTLTEQQESLRASDPVKIARTFRQTRWIYQGDSRQRVDNLDYHPPICQTEDGKYITESGMQLSEDDIPEYILALGAPPELTPERSKKKLSMRDAMLDAGVPDTDPTSQLQKALTQQNETLRKQNDSLRAQTTELQSQVKALLEKFESKPARK